MKFRLVQKNEESGVKMSFFEVTKRDLRISKFLKNNIYEISSKNSASVYKKMF